MNYNPYFDVPEHLPKGDQELIQKAQRSYSWDINPELAETEEGRQALSEIRSRHYHIEEAKCDAI